MEYLKKEEKVSVSEVIALYISIFAFCFSIFMFFYTRETPIRASIGDCLINKSLPKYTFLVLDKRGNQYKILQSNTPKTGKHLNFYGLLSTELYGFEKIICKDIKYASANEAVLVDLKELGLMNSYKEVLGGIYND